MAWIEPFVSWLASHIPTKDDFNRIEGNILHLYVNKVTKVEGKNLSTNDYTTTEKDKLAGIESGARKSMPASEILTELKTVDGPGSGLDADTLDGNNSSAFAPSSHASSDTTYGVGTTANYGHCKTINGLTQASHVNGTALSAYQGKVLNDKFTPVKGTYTGNDTAGRIIDLGFRPSFVLIIINGGYDYYGAIDGNVSSNIEIVSNGFKLGSKFLNFADQSPHHYVAFK